MNDLVEGLCAHLAETRLVPPAARVLVAYSGGADSTCLLHALHRSRIAVCAGHLHHGQRDEAEDEMRGCEEFARSLLVPFAGGRADVPKMAKELKIGLEEAGRKARYEFLQKAALKCRCDLIATAHTRDDHVETILLNLVRGTGMTGLAGIPNRRDNIVRPLLIFSRKETRSYCAAQNLWFHDDPANSDLTFSRTRVRLKVMPQLRRVNSGAEEAMVRMAEILAEEDGFLNGMAAAGLEQSEIDLNGGLKFVTVDCEVAFDRAKLTSLPPVLVKRGLRLATAVIGGALNRDQTVLLVEGLRSEPRGSVTAEGGRTVVEWDEGRVTVRDLQPMLVSRFPLTVPGETTSVESGWTITVREQPRDDFERERRSLDAVVDADALHGEPYIRSATAGDSMVPLGMSGKRKLSDLFGEAGLTHAARRRLPIICDMIGPIWVPGICMAERVKIAQDTLHALELRFGPQSPHRPGLDAT